MENNFEHIGKIALDFSCYAGEDIFDDGALGDELLQIARDLSPVEYASVIEERKSSGVLYQFSQLRENLVDWIPIEKNAKILEVGSSYGAITGALSRKAYAGSVTCIDPSKKRSLANAYRHGECENISIRVGSFKDIEPNLDRDYDYIFLVDTFSYASSYLNEENPQEALVRNLKGHLKKSGRIVIAIENKLGLKYFAGCKEDHLGTYFSGIENYVEGKKVTTFSRVGLERIFKRCGIGEYHFYYPYPDYKFMTTLYSDEYQPGKGELSNNFRNFDGDRMLLFDEKNAFDGIAEDGLFRIFSNSFLAVLGEGFETKYVKYSNDRASEFAIRTEILKDAEGKPVVRKYPYSQASREHVQGMKTAYESLNERYEGSGLAINVCKLQEGEDLFAEFEFVEGRPLSELMDECLERQDHEKFLDYFKTYLEKVGYNEEAAVSDYDLIFSNILVDGDKWTLIDYEWTFGKPIKTTELAFRAVYCYLLENEKRNSMDLDAVMELLDISESQAEDLRLQEREFQSFVTGNKKSMSEMRDLIGYKMMVPQKWIDSYRDSERINQVQIYEDRGEGYKEEESYFIPEAYLGQGRIEASIAFDGNVKMLRIDPALCSCVIKITELKLNDEPVDMSMRKLFIPNGRILKNGEKSEFGYMPSIVFSSQDPNLNIDLSLLDIKGENVLDICMDIVRLPENIAKDMENSVKRLI